MSSVQAKSLDFEIVKEPWNKYELGDYTILKTRVILRAITRTMDGDKRNYALSLQNLQSTMSPNELKGPSENRRYSKQELESNTQDMRYSTLAEEWNEYIVDDGTKIRLKTTVTSVRKSDKFSSNGDPIYLVGVSALSQTILPKS